MEEKGSRAQGLVEGRPQGAGAWRFGCGDSGVGEEAAGWNDSQGASMTSPRARTRVCGTCKNAQARRGDYIVCKLLPVHEWRAGTLACKFSPERWVAI